MIEKEMSIATWSRVLGEVFWHRLNGANCIDGFDKYEVAGLLIDKIEKWGEYDALERYNGIEEFAIPDNEPCFDEARALFCMEWKSALEEMETWCESSDSELTWDDIWGELRICANSGRPMCKGFIFDRHYYSTMADLLMDRGWSEYLKMFNNNESDDAYYTEWEGYVKD